MTYISEKAVEMANCFEECAGYAPAENMHYLNDFGLNSMGELFEEVVPQVRAAVFVAFLEELDNRDINYDHLQFGETVQ